LKLWRERRKSPFGPFVGRLRDRDFEAGQVKGETDLSYVFKKGRFSERRKNKYFESRTRASRKGLKKGRKKKSSYGKDEWAGSGSKEKSEISPNTYGKT